MRWLILLSLLVFWAIYHTEQNVKVMKEDCKKTDLYIKGKSGLNRVYDCSGVNLEAKDD